MIYKKIMTYKSCSKCGKIHPASYKCRVGIQYNGGIERKLRSTYAWTKKAEEIKERAHFLCEVCRDQGVYTYNGLETHHITKVRDDESKLLDNENLIVLCEEHHSKADRGEISANYLRELALKRESDIEMS